MNGQLNGLTKGWPNHPNQQNRIWAQHLADAALVHPQVSSEDEALPTDVLVIVAEFLAGDRDLKTLANLNIAGRHIHEGTLPVLYETLILATEKAVECFVRNAKPTVWKYVKFLFVIETDIALLQGHLQKQTQKDRPSLDDLLTTSFPRLTVFGSTDLTSPAVPSRNHNRRLHLTLYKPFKLDDLLGPCIPNESQEDGVGITFFGTRFLLGAVTEGPIRIEPDLFGDVVALSFRPGTFILNDLAVGMDGWHASYSGINFRLDIVDEVDQPGVVDTLRTVIDYLALYASKKMVEKKRDVRLGVKCTPRVLEKVIEMYEARPCFLIFEVDLTAPVTEEDMQRYLLAFGSAYRQHWSTHARHPVNGQIFLAIQAPAPALDPSWWREYNLANDPEAEHMWMQWHGDGHYGIDDNDFDEGRMENADANDDEPAGPVVRDNERSGFALTLSRDLMCRDQHQDGEIIWSRSYRVAAPPPAAPTNGHQGGSGGRPPSVPRLSENQLRALLLAHAQAAQRAQGPLAAQPLRRATTPERVARIRTQRESLRQNPALVRQLMAIDPELLRQFLRRDDPQPLPDVLLDITQARVADMDIADSNDEAERDGEEPTGSDEVEDGGPDGR